MADQLIMLLSGHLPVSSSGKKKPADFPVRRLKRY